MLDENILCDKCRNKIYMRDIKYSECYRYSEKKGYEEVVFPCHYCSHILYVKGYRMSRNQLRS